MTLVRHLCSSGMIVLDNFLSEKDITNRTKGVNKAGDGIITYHLLTTAKVLQRLFNMLKSYMNILAFFWFLLLLLLLNADTQFILTIVVLIVYQQKRKRVLLVIADP